MEVPDTLDLVERAKLGLNALIGTIDTEHGYEPFMHSVFTAPPYMMHISSMMSGVLPKYLEALPLVRAMTGSTFGWDTEQNLLEVIYQNTSHDGLIYDCQEGRPWNVGVGYGDADWKEDYANIAGNGRWVCAADFYRQATGDGEWEKRLERAAVRICELTVEKDDYAYYPNLGCGNDFSYPKHSGWTHTDEPATGTEGCEGATTFYQSLPIRGMVKLYNLNGDKKILDICKKITAFVMRPRFWGGHKEYNETFGAKRGHWWNHPHATLGGQRGLLEYAIAAEDFEVLEFVHDSYQWYRQNSCVPLGLMTNVYEGCTNADLVALGIQLSDSGIGDYWDDVDRVVRNTLCETQFTEADNLHLFCDAHSRYPPTPTPRWFRQEGRKSDRTWS